jgi:hypothetical protein
MRAIRALLGAVVAVGCGANPAARPAHAPVELSETLPTGYEALGEVSAECRMRPPGPRFNDEPATSFSCSRAELGRALVEQVNARGGSLLAAERCSRRAPSGLVCSAEAAWPGAGGSPGPSQAWTSAEDDDELEVTVASRIRIDVEPGKAPFARRPRGPDAVTEFVSLPIGHVEVGLMRAHCPASECDAASARAGLRIAASGLGVTDLVGVRCFSLEDERACVATLGVTERDPDTDPAAR